MSTLRKVFTSAVMMVTVLSLSVVAAPAKAASAGDLVKVDGASAVYYLGDDMRLYVFPNEDVYFSWYNDFSSVVTISATELNSYGVPKANITMRPGTKLVKRPVPTAPEVYAVEPGGMLRWIDSEATAKTLYGDDWAKRVVDVTDAFFTNYLADDAKTDKVTGNSYPAGSLVKWEGSADVYYIDENGDARKVANESAFVANRFSWDDIIKAPSSISMPSAGDDITGFDSDISDPSGSATGKGSQPGSGTGLSVALASDTPASATVPSNATQVVMTKFNVTASSDGDITVKNVTVTRSGIGSTSEISKVYLYDGATRLTTGKTVNSTTNEVTFSSVDVKVAAGKTKTLSVVIDVASSATGNHAFGIQEASDITTKSSATVSGSFPVRGNTMSMSSTSVGTLTLSQNNGTSGDTINVGQDDVEIADFYVDNNNVEDVALSGITLTNGGNALNANLGNIKLFYDGEVIATGELKDNKIAFSFDPITIEKGASNENFKVRADIESGIDNTVKLYIAYATDITAVGATYGYNTAATISSWDSSSKAYPITIDGAEVTVNFATDNAETVIADQKNFNFATLEVTVAEEIEVTEMRVTVDETDGGDTGVIDIDELQIHNKTTDEYVDGTVVPGNDDDAATDVIWKFENFTWNPGSEDWEIIGDIPSTASSSDAYNVTIDLSSNFTARYVASNNEVGSSDLSTTSLTGKKKTIDGSTLTVVAAAFNTGDAVANTKNVVLAGGRFDANSVSDITITEMKFEGASTTSLTNDTAAADDNAFDKTNISSIRLKVNGETVSTKSGGSLTNGEVTFNSFTKDVKVPASGNATFQVEADIAGTLDTTWKHLHIQLSTITAKDKNNDSVTKTDAADSTAISASISASNRVLFGRLVTLRDNGVLTIEMDNNVDPVDADRYLLAGTTDKKVARFKLTSQYEDIRIDKLIVANNDKSAGDTISTMKITDANGNVLASNPIVVDGGGSASTTITFEDQSGLFTAAKGTAYYYLTANTNNIGDGAGETADSQDYYEVMVKSVEAQGAAGSDLTASSITYTGTEAIDGGTSADRTGPSKKATVVGNKISSLVDATTGNLATGEQTIFKFTVTTSGEATNSSSASATAGTLNAILEELALTLNYKTTTMTSTAVDSTGELKLYRQGVSGYATASIPATGSKATFTLADSVSYDTWTQAQHSEIAPGTSATFYVKAPIDSADTNDYVQVKIANVDGSSDTLGTNYDVKWQDDTGNMMYDLRLGFDELIGASVN